MTDEACVFVVDDDPSVRKSLTFLMESVQLTVRAYESAQDFLDNCSSHPLGCLVLDLRMPGMSGLELIEKMPALGLTIPVIVITGYADVPTAVRALKAGAYDLLEKPFSDQILLERIQEAIRKHQQTRLESERREEVRRKVESLTQRQREILEFVVKGETSKTIAERLGLALSTVEGHRIQAMRKLGAGNVADVVRLVASVDLSSVPAAHAAAESDAKSES